GADQRAQGGRGVGGVADDPQDRAEPGREGEQERRCPQLRGLAGEQGEAERAPAGVADRAGLRAVAAARAAEGMRCRPPFAPAAFWWARTEVPSRKISPRSGRPASRRWAK